MLLACKTTCCTPPLLAVECSFLSCISSHVRPDQWVPRGNSSGARSPYKRLKATGSVSPQVQLYMHTLPKEHHSKVCLGTRRASLARRHGTQQPDLTQLGCPIWLVLSLYTFVNACIDEKRDTRTEGDFMRIAIPFNNSTQHTALQASKGLPNHSCGGGIQLLLGAA